MINKNFRKFDFSYLLEKKKNSSELVPSLDQIVFQITVITTANSLV